ncbi:MAG: hypothetical protein V1746_02065 [bacterium]
MENTHQLLLMLMGAALLLAGRKLFWLFVGIVGFVLGVQFLGPMLAGAENSWLSILVVGLIGGLLGMLLAIFMQGIAIIFAGFVAGGKILIFLAQLLMPLSINAQFVFSIIGGIVGAVFLLMFFDTALIVMTSLWGASLLVSQFVLDRETSLLLFVLLTIIGVSIQSTIIKS